MAQDVILFNPTTKQRRRVYTVDARELLRGDNSEGWVVYEPEVHGPQAKPGIVDVGELPAPKPGAAGKDFGAAIADAPPTSKGAGFAPPLGDPRAVASKSSMKAPKSEDV